MVQQSARWLTRISRHLTIQVKVGKNYMQCGFDRRSVVGHRVVTTRAHPGFVWSNRNPRPTAGAKNFSNNLHGKGKSLHKRTLHNFALVSFSKVRGGWW